MPCISNLLGTPLLDPASKQTGNHEDNASRVTKANHLNIKDLARHPSTPPPHQDPGITNQFQWISIKLECQEETGEGEEGVHKEET